MPHHRISPVTCHQGSKSKNLLMTMGYLQFFFIGGKPKDPQMTGGQKSFNPKKKHSRAQVI